MSTYTRYNYLLEETFPDLPFDINLSLEQVFDFWERKRDFGSAVDKIFAEGILTSVSHAEVLRAPITDLGLLEAYRTEIATLLSALFPEMLSSSEVKSASLPFIPVLFNLSQNFELILSSAGADFHFGLKDLSSDDVYKWGCSRIIESVYHIPVKFRHPLKVDVPDEAGEMIRHFKVDINKEFSSIKPKTGTPPLSAADIELLLDHSDDILLWRKLIPPNSYTYQGMHIISLFDQTEQESLSALKQLLLQSNALQDHKILDQIEHQIAKYLGTGKIDLGFDAFDENGCVIRALHGSATSSKLLEDAFETSIDEWFNDTSFDGLLKNKEVFVVSRIHEMKSSPSPLVRRMQDKGIGSFVIAPLSDGDKLIAFIELTSFSQGALNSMVASKVKDVLPFISMVVGRTISHHQMELEAIIQDKFTSLHPSVNWKFLKAAEAIFQQQHSGKTTDTEIVFQDVFPLYGQFDIRGSSHARNASLLSDLLEQIGLAEDVLVETLRHDKLPIYEQLLFRLKAFDLGQRDELNAGEEAGVVDFMRQDLEPVFQFLKTQEPMRGVVERYVSELDSKLGIIHKKRKAYEQSVNLINERIADYINQQQIHAQLMFPHYFDKFKTDGVEYNAFIGQSLVQTKSLNPLHLKNLRLWQLLVVCGVEHIHQLYKHELPMTLDITPLVLVYGQPIAIRFRLDERRFDVDGAYNARYEILKKRIDKAHIKETHERLTQPGKMCIVFSHESEGEEYLQYIRYLQSCHYLDDHLERVLLEDMQGAIGLQAFRVGFSIEASPDDLIREMMQEVEAQGV